MLPRDPSRRDILGGAAALAVNASFGLPAAATSGNARFDVSGNRLLYAGKQVRLLGVGIGDPIYVRADRPLSDYKVLAGDWRSTAVRISLHPGHWRQDKLKATKLLERDVAAARAANLFVIIDWHAIGFPGHYAESVDPSWGLPLDAFDSDHDLAIDFWRDIAGLFGSDPGVLFELWNEPVYDGRLWKSTGEHWPILKETWLRLIEQIRKSSDAVVIAAGGRWAHDLVGVAGNLIDDPRVIYSWHCYPNEDRGVATRWPDSLAGLPAIKPVVVSEWGFSRDGHDAIRGTPEDFGEPFARDVLEALKLHSFAWCFSPGATPRILAPDGVSTTEYGTFVKNYLEHAWRPEEQRG